jgi:hypothetical protein
MITKKNQKCESDIYIFDIIKLKNEHFMKKNIMCQSCGYPMQKDIKGGGTNTDGSINEKYCSMCYEGGKFLNPPEVDTAQKFQTYCIEEMKKDGMNGLLAWILTRGIPKLER